MLSSDWISHLDIIAKWPVAYDALPKKFKRQPMLPLNFFSLEGKLYAIPKAEHLAALGDWTAVFDEQRDEWKSANKRFDESFQQAWG